VVCLVDCFGNPLHSSPLFFSRRMPGGASINRTGILCLLSEVD
jgi:hypothetical protein